MRLAPAERAHSQTGVARRWLPPHGLWKWGVDLSDGERRRSAKRGQDGGSNLSGNEAGRGADLRDDDGAVAAGRSRNDGGLQRDGQRFRPRGLNDDWVCRHGSVTAARFAGEATVTVIEPDQHIAIWGRGDQVEVAIAVDIILDDAGDRLVEVN